MGASPELRSAFAAVTDDLLERLQRLVDEAVEQARAKLQEEHALALRRLEEERAGAERESQLLWADVSAAQAKVAQREADLEAEAGALRKETEAMTRGRADDVLELSLAGERDVSVLRSTLCAVEGSMLAATFSGRWDEGMPKDSRGRYFIDYPPVVFDPLLGYLREAKLASPDAPVPWPPPVLEENLSLFRKMADYYGVAPPPVLLRTPSRFAGTNNSCDIDGSPEAIRVSADVPIVLHGIQVLGPRTEESVRYIGWLAVHRGEDGVAHQEVDYTVEATEGVAAELMLDSPVAFEANTDYDIVLCVRGPPSTCGESHGLNSEVAVGSVTVTFASSPLDEAGTGLLEGVIPGIVFSLQQ